MKKQNRGIRKPCQKVISGVLFPQYGDYLPLIRNRWLIFRVALIVLSRTDMNQILSVMEKWIVLIKGKLENWLQVFITMLPNLLLSILIFVPEVKNDKSQVLFTDYNGDTIKMEVHCWVDNTLEMGYNNTRDKVLRQIHAGITPKESS
jgi:hypothetical protein